MHNPDHENGLARPSPAFLVSAPRSAPAALARHPRKTPRLAPARSRSASIGAPGWRWGQSRANPLANVHDSPLHTPASLMVREDPGSAPFWPSSAPGSRGHQPNATARIDDEPSSLIRTGTTTGGRSRPLGAGHTGIGCGSAMTSRSCGASGRADRRHALLFRTILKARAAGTYGHCVRAGRGLALPDAEPYDNRFRHASRRCNIERPWTPRTDREPK